MSSRDAILARLRAATRNDTTPPPPVADRELFADYPGDDLAAHFGRVLDGLTGTCIAVPDATAAAVTLAKLLAAAPETARGIVATDEPLVNAVLAAAPALAAQCQRSLAPASDEAAALGVGITGAAALIARTGSVVLRATDSGRRASVLPPLHVVLASRDSLRPSLAEAMALLGEAADWSYATIVSGPSRTADIEKILVLGAHGPRRLVVILIG